MNDTTSDQDRTIGSAALRAALLFAGRKTDNAQAAKAKTRRRQRQNKPVEPIH